MRAPRSTKGRGRTMPTNAGASAGSALPTRDLAALQLRLVCAEARARVADATLRMLLASLAAGQPEGFRLVAEGLRTFAAGLGDRSAADAYHGALATEIRGVIDDMLTSIEPVRH